VTWDDVRRALRLRPPLCVSDAAQRAAVAMILREGGRGLETLFIRRAEHPEDPWSGQMGFPGGRAEAGDADLTGTAVRETAEEIGIDLGLEAELLGGLDEIRAMARMRPVDLAITPFVFRLHAPVKPCLSGEVVAIHWLGLDDLLDPAHRTSMDYRHEGTLLQFPCTKVGDVVIWGLTYRMLTGFEKRLGPAPAAPAAETGRGEGL
jgi:8-oxo-dGTP pyrophosphatase MutT (NUDIX family)